MSTDSVETILHSGIQMVYCIGTSTCVKCIAVSQEYLSSERADHIDDTSRIVRTDVGKVARFSEMDLDRCKLVLEVDISDSCFSDKLFELYKKVVARYSPEVSKEYFRLFHS